MDTIEVIVPAGADETDVLDFSLVVLTEAISKLDEDKVVHGFLGGEFGYGAHWDNDVFQMHPYCWCEQPDCAWCYGCTCGDNTMVDYHTTKPGIKCDWCSEVHKYGGVGALPPDDEPHYGAPHFWHKPSGFRVWWYKYIGRGMNVHNPNNADVAAIFRECMKSLATHA